MLKLQAIAHRYQRQRALLLLRAGCKHKQLMAQLLAAAHQQRTIAAAWQRMSVSSLRRHRRSVALTHLAHRQLSAERVAAAHTKTAVRKLKRWRQHTATSKKLGALAVVAIAVLQRRRVQACLHHWHQHAAAAKASRNEQQAALVAAQLAAEAAAELAATVAADVVTELAETAAAAAWLGLTMRCFRRHSLALVHAAAANRQLLAKRAATLLVVAVKAVTRQQHTAARVLLLRWRAATASLAAAARASAAADSAVTTSTAATMVTLGQLRGVLGLQPAITAAATTAAATTAAATTVAATTAAATTAAATTAAATATVLATAEPSSAAQRASLLSAVQHTASSSFSAPADDVAAYVAHMEDDELQARRYALVLLEGPYKYFAEHQADMSKPIKVRTALNGLVDIRARVHNPTADAAAEILQRELCRLNNNSEVSLGSSEVLQRWQVTIRQFAAAADQELIKVRTLQLLLAVVQPVAVLLLTPKSVCCCAVIVHSSASLLQL
jgi:hypothetical protein